MSNEKLISALMNAQLDMQHAKADGRNPMFKNEYATYEQVVDTVKPILLDNSIYFQQKSHLNDRGACVETVFYGHGGMLETGPVLVVADKVTPQGFGSAMTYAKRYSLSMACAVGCEPDDDAEKAEASYRAKKPDLRPVKPSQDVKAAPLHSESMKYQLLKDSKMLVGKNDPEGFLKACRDLLADPSSKQCQEIYNSSKQEIASALSASSGKTADSFKILMGLYGGNNAS
jgi:hypothetical protein